MDKTYYTYIMASKRNGTLYVGVTSDLIKRAYEHKNNLVEGFTSKYDIHQLVYFEQHLDVNAAIRREKRLKEWHRNWKLALIEIDNPNWRDLHFEITESGRPETSDRRDPAANLHNSSIPGPSGQ